MTQDVNPNPMLFNHHPSCASSPTSQHHTVPAKKPIV